MRKTIPPGTEIKVPVSLLLAKELLPSARLVWMLHQLLGAPRATDPAPLQETSGLSRPTILKALAQLAAGDWALPPTAEPRPGPKPGTSPPTAPRPHTPTPTARGVSVPGPLLCDWRMGAFARVLYCVLKTAPGFQQEQGQITITALCARTGASRNTVKQGIRDLVQAGWLKADQTHKRAPVAFTLFKPVDVQAESEVAASRGRYTAALHRGEALMKEYLSLLVDSQEYDDNARPGFLSNPLTGQRMEFDRFYLSGVAFEFQGPQHDGPTEGVSEEEASQQRARDLMKRGICSERGITLVEVRLRDLSLEGMKRKVGQLLPLRDLAGHERLIANLEATARRYRQGDDRLPLPAKR